MTTVLNAREAEEIERANASDLPAVVFVHGLWLLADSWTAWRELFETRGYTTIAPGWPDDPATTEAARSNSNALAGKGIREVTEHYADAIRKLNTRPAVIGHSFGGLIAQKLAGEGSSACTIAIDPAPGRGVLPVSFSALRAGFPVFKNPANTNKTVMLSYKEFRYAFANVVDEAEAKALYERYCVPAPGRPLFQAVASNLNPATEAAIDYRSDERGPLLVIEGGEDNTIPWAIANATFKLQQRNPAVTEIHKIPGRGHSLTIDSGWNGVAEVALEFLSRNYKA
jgi:non-heme chloroperoxidase